MLDLTESTEFTFALLDDTWAWRQRLTERFTFASAWHTSVESAYQIELPAALVARALGREPDIPPTAVRALVPLTTRPKRILLGFEVRSATGQPVHRLPRLSIASIEAEYLTRLRLLHPFADHLEGSLPTALLEAVALATPDVFLRSARDGEDIKAMRGYLADAMELHVGLDDVKDWDAAQRRAGALLAEALGEPADPWSCSENVLIALPYLSPRPSSAEEIAPIVGAYADAIERIAGEHAHDPLLVTLAEYGRRWEVIVETQLSLQEPTTITLVEEQRLLGPSLRGRTIQRLAPGDARSAHAEFRVLDRAVTVESFAVRDVNGQEVPSEVWEGVRHTPETLALYTAVRVRPYYVDVTLVLRPSGSQRLVTWAFHALLLSAIATTQRVSDAELVETLALLTVPTAFAAALLLVREQTTLAARLQHLSRVTLLSLVAVLWAIVVTRVW